MTRNRIQASTAVNTRPPSRRIRAAAVGVAVLTSIMLWSVANALGGDIRVDQHNGQGPQTIGLPMIIGSALAVSLLGWGALAVLERFTPWARTIWTTLALTVLALSFIPIIATSATVSAKTTLALIHITVAAALIPALRHGQR